MKLNEEQISRVLSDHADKLLQRRGAGWGNSRMCLIQSAFNTLNISEVGEIGRLDLLWEEASYFDLTYDEDWSVEEFIAYLEKRELI